MAIHLSGTILLKRNLHFTNPDDGKSIAFFSPFASGFTKEEILAIVAALEEKHVQRIA